MKKCLIVAITIVAFTGCITEPKVESTKQWEGHYFTTQEFVEKTSNIELEKDESIWVLSNYTLNRLLKNTRK